MIIAELHVRVSASSLWKFN